MLDLLATLPEGTIAATVVAKHFGVNRRTVQRWIAERGLKADLWEGKVYTTKEALRQFARRGQPASTDSHREIAEESQAVRERLSARFGV